MNKDRFVVCYRFLGGVAWIETLEGGNCQAFFTYDFKTENRLSSPVADPTAAENKLLQSDPALQRYGSWGDMPVYWKFYDDSHYVVIKKGDDDCNTSVPARGVPTGSYLSPKAADFFRFWKGPAAVSSTGFLR